MWRIIILLLISLVAVPAYSNPPSPAPSKSTHQPETNSKQHEENPATDQRGSESSPVFIKVMPPLTLEPQATKETEKGHDYTSAEWWLVYITGFLVVATCGLIVYTAFLWGATSKGAELPQKLERAYVFAKVEVVGSITTTFKGTTARMARTLFVNHGRTPAIIINMSGAPYFLNKAPQQLARTPDDDRRIPEGWVIAGGEPFQRPIEIELTDPQLKAVHDGTLKLYCAGLIRYKDILGEERETGYCWEYLPEYGRFQFCKESNLNHYN